MRSRRLAEGLARVPKHPARTGASQLDLPAENPVMHAGSTGWLAGCGLALGWLGRHVWYW